ncbi:nickel ABC transporter permease subunit NikC [Romboutsia sp.]|uniref:nickel ABC transporter permease subunit NikC n=1 Tax=Romboutsia sp. TaxID=1965302 RepID=UPI002BD65244|nr:nickel ABC transporter permease subunit NikC [Romboutsia sp.]HSQ88235.1 nickel ABC transporter permease subunit NikC [Romboutsia sp.]
MKINKKIKDDKLAFIGLIIILLIVIMGIFANYIAPNNPIEVDLSKRLEQPGNIYPLGTDHLGRCILSRLIYGIRISLGTSFILLFIILTIGISIGLIAGYFGGIIDEVIMRAIDIILAFPGLILDIAIAGILGPSLVNLMIAIASVQWVGYARIIRGMVLSIKEQEFVLAARVMGNSDFKIITKHILPNIISQIIILATLDMGSIILRISGLSFLGLGAQPPTPEWGAMLNDARPYMQIAPWLMIFPGASILVVVMSFNLFGDGLRDLLDPK